MDKGLEIEELADVIGVTSDSVINWEIREVKPRKESLKKLTRTLDFL
ncbi:MAG: helix-turn-helix domain-containing protein [Candidatus Omnitrophica bacterium]|nr:helix-turn-helix domain-containing protein [Candidatus Omnitrophota bacterium]